MKVLIQNSHYQAGRPNGWSGAPGEADWVLELNKRIETMLIQNGVTVVRVDGDLVDHPAYHIDYDAFITPHYEADVHQGRGGAFWGRATNSATAAADDRLGNLVWARLKQIEGHPQDAFQWNNPNVTDYYGFRLTSANTPGVLVEHGVGWGADRAWLREKIGPITDAWVGALLEFGRIATDPFRLAIDKSKAIYPDIIPYYYERVMPDAGDPFFHGINAVGLPRLQAQNGTTSEISAIHEVGHAFEALIVRKGTTLDAFRTKYWQFRGFPGTWLSNAPEPRHPGESVAETFMNSVYGRFVREKAFDFGKPVDALKARDFFQKEAGMALTEGDKAVVAQIVLDTLKNSLGLDAPTWAFVKERLSFDANHIHPGTPTGKPQDGR